MRGSSLLFVLGLAVGALSQPALLRPGSVLLYPLLEAQRSAGQETILAVTNTNTSRVVSPQNRWRYGDVQLHFHYVDGRGPYNRVFDRLERLTPGDTLVLVASRHAPDVPRGYLLVVAEDPETGKAVAFDHLVGREILVDLRRNALWALPAVSFRSRVTDGAKDRNGRYFTDKNGNGSVDFDGAEYDLYPDLLYLASFAEQGPQAHTELVFVSGLGSYYLLRMGVLFYDNEEDAYSRDFQFTCWTRIPLESLSRVTRRLGGTPREAPVGWARFDGTWAIHVLTGKLWRGENASKPDYDPPFLGACVEQLAGGPFLGGHLLHFQGGQNGNEFPWRLPDD